jgi:hypothetical protein
MARIEQARVRGAAPTAEPVHATASNRTTVLRCCNVVDQSSGWHGQPVLVRANETNVPSPVSRQDR